MVLFIVATKPLCSSYKGNISYLDYAEITIYSDYVKYYEDNYIEYYINPTESSKTMTIKFAENYLCKLNGNDSDISHFVDYDDAIITFYDSDLDGKCEKVIANSYVHGYVEAVSSSKQTITILGKKISLTSGDVELISSDNEQLSLSDFSEGDLVAVSADSVNYSEYKNYIKIVRLDNHVISGTVDECYSSIGLDYVVINSKEYIDNTGNYLTVGDEGIFYIGITGKIVDFKGVDNSLKGYILEAAVTSAAFTGDKWQVKLLTQNGVEVFDTTYNASEEFNYYLEYCFGNTYDFYLFNDYEFNVKRFIKYEINANNEIDYFDQAYESIAECSGTYNSAINRLGTIIFDETIPVYALNTTKADDTLLVGFDSLINGETYEGYAIKNDGNEYIAYVLLNGELNIEDSGDSGSELVEKSGYLLEAAVSSNSFTAGTWDIKILTENEGIVIYPSTKEGSDRFFEYATGYLGVVQGENEYLYHTSDRQDTDRYVSYTVNSIGEITDIYHKEASMINAVGKYDEQTKKIGNVIFEADTKIYVINSEDVDDVCVVDFSFLNDGENYCGYAVNIDDKNNAYILIDGTVNLPEYIPVITEKRGYLLEAAVNSSSYNETWDIKVLTEDDGIVTYSSTNEGSQSFADYIVNSLGISYEETKCLYDDLMHLKNSPCRLIDFKVNEDNKIVDVSMVDGVASNVFEEEYSASDKTLGDRTVDENTVIYNLLSNDVSGVYRADISDLCDSALYSGFILNTDGNSVLVITDVTYCISKDSDFTIVTKIAIGKNEIGDEVLKISYVSNESEGVIVVDDNSVAIGRITADELSIGDVFCVFSEKDGVARSYGVIGQYSYNYNYNERNFSINEKFLDEVIIDRDVEFIYGYISNEARTTNSKGEILTVNDDYMALITTDTNKYVYNDVGRNTTIEFGYYMAEDIDYFDSESNKASRVFMKVSDGIVTDIYAFTGRINISK